MVLVCLDWPHQNEINVFPFEGGNSNRINSLHSLWFDSVVVLRSSLKGGVIPAQLQCGLKCKVPLGLPVLLKGPEQGKEINAGKQSLSGRKVLCQMGVKSCRRKVNSDVPTDFREASREHCFWAVWDACSITKTLRQAWVLPWSPSGSSQWKLWFLDTASHRHPLGCWNRIGASGW